MHRVCHLRVYGATRTGPLHACLSHEAGSRHICQGGVPDGIGWLLEKVARDALDRTGVITWDYLPTAGGMPGRQPLCLVCQVYGGPYREHGEGSERQHSALRGVLAFSFGRSDALQSGTTETKAFQFPNVELRKQAQSPKDRARDEKEYPVVIHGLATDSSVEDLVIKISPYSEFALALACLSADLISPGFFRWGRFSSRGYGLVRLVPQTYAKDPLSAWLMAGKPGFQEAGGRTGFELVREITAQDPIAIVVERIEGALGQQGATVSPST